MCDFGMKLQAENRLLVMLDGGKGTSVGHRERGEMVAEILHLIAVAHPNGEFVGQPREQAAAVFYLADGAAELARFTGRNTAALRPARELHAVANSQNRDVEIEDPRIGLRRTRAVHAVGSARKDEAA